LSQSSTMNAESHRFFRNITRVSVPPGGRASDIFGRNESEMEKSPNARKVKDYQKSSIFDAPDSNANFKKASSPRYMENSQARIFGGEEVQQKSPGKMNDTWRSNLFCEANPANLSPHQASPNRKIERNPITGELNGSSPNGHEAAANGKIPNGHHTEEGSNGVCNGKTNGYH